MDLRSSRPTRREQCAQTRSVVAPVGLPRPDVMRRSVAAVALRCGSLLKARLSPVFHSLRGGAGGRAGAVALRMMLLAGRPARKSPFRLFPPPRTLRSLPAGPHVRATAEHRGPLPRLAVAAMLSPANSEGRSIRMPTSGTAVQDKSPRVRGVTVLSRSTRDHTPGTPPRQRRHTHRRGRPPDRRRIPGRRCLRRQPRTPGLRGVGRQARRPSAPWQGYGGP